MPDKEQSTTEGPVLGAEDVLGVVQRTLHQLHGYCAQPPYAVDRDVCLHALQKAAYWLGHLPPLPKAQDKELDRVRAN